MKIQRNRPNGQVFATPLTGRGRRAAGGTRRTWVDEEDGRGVVAADRQRRHAWSGDRQIFDDHQFTAQGDHAGVGQVVPAQVPAALLPAASTNVVAPVPSSNFNHKAKPVLVCACATDGPASMPAASEINMEHNRTSASAVFRIDMNRMDDLARGAANQIS